MIIFAGGSCYLSCGCGCAHEVAVVASLIPVGDLKLQVVRVALVTKSMCSSL